MNKKIFNVFVDVETNGTNPYLHDIIQLASIITDSKGIVIGDFYECGQPESEKRWDKGAESIHGISYSWLLNNGHRIDKLFCHYSSWLSSYKVSSNICLRLIDHSNNRFDWRFLKGLFFKVDKYYEFYKYFHGSRYESTIDLAKSSIYTYENYKLSTLCYYHNIELKHHNARSDVYACMELYKIYKELI